MSCGRGAVSRPAFVRAQADLTQAILDLSNVPSSLGVARLDAMLTRLRHAIPRLRGATTWLALAPDLLGAHRPATYLFVWQNPAELRATGGFMGASDLVTIDRGRISHRFYGHALPHDITWPPMPLPEEMYTPETTWLFEDSNWSPDFPLSARFERWFYGEDTGRWAMGVVNFLDTATPDLLRATGPVYLPRYRVTVDARTVTPLAQRFVNIVNARYNGVDNSPAGDRIRKQFFVSVMQALLDRAQHVSLDRLPALGRAVARMIQRRELLAYDRREAVEGAIRMAGADGGMVSGPGDYLFVVDDNRSYNKLNPYVREGATLAVTVTRSLALDETLTIRYHVDPSPANLEGGGPNWGLWGTKHDYQDFLRIYVPLGATLVSVSGMDPWSPQIAYGRTQFAGRLLVREGQSRTVAVRYRVPANVFLGQGRPRSGSGPWTYRLRVQQQPGTNLKALRVLIRAGAGVRVEGGSRPYETTLPLQVGARLRIAVTGQVNPKPVVLPRLPLEPDPYIPFQYLQDRRHPL